MRNGRSRIVYGAGVATLALTMVAGGCSSMHHNDKSAASSSGAYASQSQSGYGSQTTGSQGYAATDRNRPATNDYERARTGNEAGRNEGMRTSNREPSTHTATTTADSRLESRVKKQLSSNKQTSSLDVDVQASKGTVTLTGRVDQPAQKKQAAAVASKVQGVKRVKNEIRVGESTRTQ